MYWHFYLPTKLCCIFKKIIILVLTLFWCSLSSADWRVGAIWPGYRWKSLQRPVHSQPCTERPFWLESVQTNSEDHTHTHMWVKHFRFLDLTPVCVRLAQREPDGCFLSSTVCSTRLDQNLATSGRFSGCLRTWWRWESATNGTSLAS